MWKGHRVRLRQRTMIGIALTWLVVSFVNVPNHLTDNLSFRQRHAQDAYSLPSLLCDQQDRHRVYTIDSYISLLRYLV